MLEPACDTTVLDTRLSVSFIGTEPSWIAGGTSIGFTSVAQFAGKLEFSKKASVVRIASDRHQKGAHRFTHKLRMHFVASAGAFHISQLK